MPASYTFSMPAERAQEPTYTLYRRGLELLEDGDFEHATAPLAEAARRAPEKTSVREALGRAYFRCGRFPAAGSEFARAVEIDPVNDYAHFGIGMCAMRTGEPDRARGHLKLATVMRPEAEAYRDALALITE